MRVHETNQIVGRRISERGKGYVLDSEGREKAVTMLRQNCPFSFLINGQTDNFRVAAIWGRALSANESANEEQTTIQHCTD